MVVGFPNQLPCVTERSSSTAVIPVIDDAFDQAGGTFSKPLLVASG
jgi:hypothetical protein